MSASISAIGLGLPVAAPKRCRCDSFRQTHPFEQALGMLVILRAVPRLGAVTGSTVANVDWCFASRRRRLKFGETICAVTSGCRKSHPPSSLIMSTPKSQAPLAMNDGEKIIDGDGKPMQWMSSATRTSIERASRNDKQFCFRSDFVLLERRLRAVLAVAVLLYLRALSPKAIT